MAWGGFQRRVTPRRDDAGVFSKCYFQIGFAEISKTTSNRPSGPTRLSAPRCGRRFGSRVRFTWQVVSAGLGLTSCRSALNAGRSRTAGRASTTGPAGTRTRNAWRSSTGIHGADAFGRFPVTSYREHVSRAICRRRTTPWPLPLARTGGRHMRAVLSHRVAK